MGDFVGQLPLVATILITLGGLVLLGLLLGLPMVTRRWIGLALLPQAGVAIGMALLASQRLPEIQDIILPVILGSTVVFELFSPVITRRVLIKVGDIQRDHP